ncbi:zinc-binding dehydrogenase [Streptomyces graminofaciens]|nr:zinc-binding dehydrogenase [Streptomyces graminofaciens]
MSSSRSTSTARCPLAEAAEALRLSQSGRVRGKIVLDVG